MDRVLLDRGKFGLVQPDRSLEDLKLNSHLAKVPEQRRHANGLYEIFLETHLRGQLGRQLRDEMVVIEKIAVIDAEDLEQAVSESKDELLRIPQLSPQHMFRSEGSADEILEFISVDEKPAILPGEGTDKDGFDSGPYLFGDQLEPFTLDPFHDTACYDQTDIFILKDLHRFEGEVCLKNRKIISLEQILEKRFFIFVFYKNQNA
jgi:hypothetical protein